MVDTNQIYWLKYSLGHKPNLNSNFKVENAAAQSVLIVLHIAAISAKVKLKW